MEQKRSTDTDKKADNVVRCLICDRYTERSKTFACRKCRNSNLCLEHLDKEYKICLSCAAEERITLFRSLRMQERSITGFLHLMQFIFIAVAILYAARRFLEVPFIEYMEGNIFFDYLQIWGIVAVAGIVLCRIVLWSQRQKIRAVEELIHGQKIFSRQTHTDRFFMP